MVCNIKIRVKNWYVCIPLKSVAPSQSGNKGMLCCVYGVKMPLQVASLM